MIMYGPGFKGGRIIDDLVSLVDLPPTVMEAAGLPVPDSMRGRPLQPLMQGTPEDWPQEVFLQISESQVGRAIRTKRWKYSVRAPHRDGRNDPDSDRYVEDFLYDLQNDPHEKYNLVRHPFYAALRAELAETLKRRMAEAGEEMAEILPAP